MFITIFGKFEKQKNYPMVYRILLLLALWMPFSTTVFGQDAAPETEGYQFTPIYDMEETDVKSQGRTGTCWSFCTASFLESEMMRRGVEPVDLSEMYIVRQVYLDKADNYIRRNGTAQFSEGGLSHDLMRAYGRAGVVPESVYDGKVNGMAPHDHSEMVEALEELVKLYAKKDRVAPEWKAALHSIMDVYMGEVPESFTYEGKTYTPYTFAEEVIGLAASDYVTITSFTHHPFYQPFVLEIPDNYSNGLYYNVPLEDMMAITDHALAEGYTIAWDGDVSEKGFSARQGLAVLPAETPRKEAEWREVFAAPVDEVVVTQENRQTAFDSKSTTDDHLMHITGMVEDQQGNRYYTVKNSWGALGPYDGFLYMSVPYYQMKTVGIMIHKDALPSSLREQLNL